MNKKLKKWLLVIGLISLVLFLGACGRTEVISPESEGFWDGFIVLNFSRIIIWLAELFNGSFGTAIIVFTVLIKVVLVPLSYYQLKSTEKMGSIQPQLDAIEQKYPSNDEASLEKKNEERARLLEEAGVNPFASLLPLIIQMPILIALYQSISRTQVISNSSFLWLNLGEPDPYFILPILAAALTFVNVKLSSMANANQGGGGMTAMTYIMPVFILFISASLPSALSLYFAVSNAFSVVQTLVINNPFEKIKKQEEEERIARENEEKRKKALKKARKTGRSVRK